MSTATVKLGDYPGRTFVHFARDVALGKAHPPLITKDVPAGTTVDDEYAWGFQTVVPGAAEFVGLLRNQTIIGRLAGLRRVPFRIPVVKQTGGGIYAWVGEGLWKPVTSSEFEKTTLVPRKSSGIIVLTRELLNAGGDAESDIRRELTDGLVSFQDQQFIDPTVGEVANVSPASITNGATPIPSTGDAGEDLRALVAAIEDAIETLAGVTLVMSHATAWGIATTVPGAFPMGLAGGLFGLLPVVLSSGADDNIVAVHGPSVLVAEGALLVDTATQAALEMAQLPGTGADQLTSLWQTNSVALRVERFINYELAVAGAVQLVTGAEYGLIS